MSVLDAEKTKKNLMKKGFKEEAGDHKYLCYYHNNRKVLQTKISHSASDIDNTLIKLMSIQCGLTKNEFLDLARCPLSAEKYMEILEKSGRLT